mgnify:CR=1 FL=1
MSTQVKALTTKLDNAVSQINQLYPQAVTETKDDVNAIRSMIKALQSDLDKKHANVQLTVTSSIDTLPIENAITKLLEKARQTQNAYNQKVSINNTLYAQFGKNIKDALAKLAEAEEHITTECPLVAENYEEDINILSESVNPERLKNNPIQFEKDIIRKMYKNIAQAEEFAEEFKQIYKPVAGVDVQYKNLALSEESEYDTDDIISKIESLIAEADKAQEIESSVESITYTDKGNAIYTLSGVRVSPSEAKKGIFIVNGKIRIFF